MGSDISLTNFQKGQIMGNFKKALSKKALAVTGKIAATAFVAGLVIVLPCAQSLRTAAATKDYDASIAALEAEIEQKKQDNAAREAQINSYTGDINENQEVIDAISAQIDGVNDEITAYGQLITAKMNEINDKELEIAAVEQSIEDKELEILNKQEEIQVLEAENKSNLEKFAKLARALYISDTSDTIPILNGSDDWYNFFVYTDVVKNISSQNLEFMNSLLNSIKEQEDMIEALDGEILELNVEKEKLEQQKLELQAEQDALEDEKSELQDYVDEQYSSLYDKASENEALKNKVANLNYAIDATNEEIEELNAAVAEEIRAKQAANSDQVVYSSDGFRWPLDSGYQLITTPFGYDAWRGGNHYGIDIGNAGIGGAPIYAAQSGTVITAYNDSGYHGGYGNYVVIDHGGGISTLYAHCVSTCVYEGQVVNKGDIIGYVGMTGWATGNHLHFEVRINGTPYDPFGYTYEYV